MKKKIAFWGAATPAKYLQLLLNQENAEIVALFDNDLAKEGTDFYGMQIASPIQIKNIDFDVLIVTSRFYKEIFTQLTETLDIPQNIIYPWYVFLPINLGEMHYQKPFDIIDPFYLYTISNEFSIQFFSKDIAKQFINPDKMNDLSKWFFEEQHRHIMKCSHYFEAYDRHFKKYRNKKVTILEIGVCDGGSLQMWKHYFGPEAKIYGVDIDPRCKDFEEDQIKIFIGDQSDRIFLNHIKNEIGTVDILIDDGGHEMNQQIATFQELYDSVSDQGVFLCEDLHSSYWENWKGEYKSNNTFIEYSKNMIDALNAYHSEYARLVPDKYTETLKSISYYDGMVFFEKKTRECFSMILH
jgi:SAM-dependent methyltransferase